MFTLGRLVCVLFAFFQLTMHVCAGATPTKRAPQVDSGHLLTNSARMAAGLGPLKPRSMLAASRRLSARVSTASILPVTGTIQIVRKSTGIAVGYISSTVGSSGYGLTSTPSSALKVTFTPIAPFNIAITGGTYPDLGFSGDDLGTFSTYPLVATNPTAPGASPQSVGNTISSSKSESSIWSYDATTRELTAQWVNAAGSSPPTHLWYVSSNNKIAIIRTPALQLTGYEVTFTLIPSP